MSMKEWAEKEVEIACKRERGNAPEEEFDYGCACYESALKAFNSLLEDGHSGMSIGFTKQILNRLIDGKPLGPIEDTDDIWEYSRGHDESYCKVYQCKRMSSLFKHVYTDGRVTYNDVNYCTCIDINNPDCRSRYGLVTRIIEEMFPITMPYYPSETPIKVYIEDFLTDTSNGDFDTVGVLFAVKPDGEKVNISRFFKEDDNHGMVEITLEEYEARRLKKVNRR